MLLFLFGRVISIYLILNPIFGFLITIRDFFKVIYYVSYGNSIFKRICSDTRRLLTFGLTYMSLSSSSESDANLVSNYTDKEGAS